MRLSLDGHGDLVIDHLTPEVAAVLAQIPELLVSDDPAVRESHRQRTYQDDDEEEQWQRFVGPELQHLFASQADVVRDDLRALQPDESSFGTLKLVLKGERQQAWIAALNGANHALVARHDLQPAELEQRPGDLGDLERDRALMSIEVFAVMLHVLLDIDGHGFPDREVIDSWQEDDHPDGTDDGGMGQGDTDDDDTGDDGSILG